MMKAYLVSVMLFWAGAVYANICENYVEAIDGTVADHLGRVRELKEVVLLFTDDAPQKDAGPLNTLRKLFRDRATGISLDDSMATFLSQVRRTIALLTTEHLQGAPEEFQKAINLLKVWDQNYPPELVNPRILGVLKALEDHSFTADEIKAFNKEMREANKRWVDGVREDLETATGDPYRKSSVFRADPAQVLRPRRRPLEFSRPSRGDGTSSP